MKFNKLIITVLTAVLLIVPCSVYAENTEEQTEEVVYSGEYYAFDKIAQYICDLYIDDSYTKDEIMAQGISKLLENNEPLLIELLKSTLSSMDDYSEFYTAEEYKQFQDELSHTFYGIGVTMTQKENDYVEITGFAEEDSKAEKAGFKIGDKIYKVDGKDMTGLSIDKVREHIIGEENTTVKITVLRDGEEIELITTRVSLHEDTVLEAVLEGNIGYIQITSFDLNTSKEFTEALNLMRENNVKNIILDLRNNPGGVVATAVEAAKQIVPKGKIIDVKYRDSQYDITFNSDLETKEFDFFVLVNENTASAAEILASAIQDSECGQLIGTTTYGKAVIQNQFKLDNGMAFKLTIGQYITRNGHQINHIGLTPDVQIENEEVNIDDSDLAAFDFKTNVSLGNSSDNVIAAKERFSIMGIYNGETSSNIMTEDFKEIISNFQKSNDIFSYGILDVATQKKIDELFSQIKVIQDNQFDKAYEMAGGKISSEK